MDGVGGDAARAVFQLNGNAGEPSNGSYSALAGNGEASRGTFPTVPAAGEVNGVGFPYSALAGNGEHGRGAFPTVPLQVGLKTHGNGAFPVPSESQDAAAAAAGLSLHLHPPETTAHRFSPFASASNGESNGNSPTWPQSAPQLRGKAVVRRGRPRQWPVTESREEARKRVKFDELCADAPAASMPLSYTPPPSMALPYTPSASMALPFTPPASMALPFTPPASMALPYTPPASMALPYTPPASMVYSTPPPAPNPFPAQQVHDNAILEPAAVLFGMSSAAVSVSVPETSAAAAGKANNLDGILRVVDRSVQPNAITRCGGITLNGNQCTHNVKDGSGYCVKHTKTTIVQIKRTAQNAGSPRGVLAEPRAPDPVILRCRGQTIAGKQCTHNVKDRMLYCMKHGDQEHRDPPAAVPTPAAVAVPFAGAQVFNQAPFQLYNQIPVRPPAPPIPAPVAVRASVEAPHQMIFQAPAPVPAQAPAPVPAETPQAPLPLSPKESDDDVVPRCAGRTRRTEDQCSFRPKAGSSFCERHARQFREKGGLDPEFTYDGPSSSSPTASFSLRRRRSKEVVNVGDSMSTRERRSVIKAKDLFNDIMNAGMLRGKAVSMDGKDLVGYVCQEAAKDAISAETLLAFLSEEKIKLSNAIVENRDRVPVAKPPAFWQIKYSPDGPRSSTELFDQLQRECLRSKTIDAVQRSASGRDAFGASGSYPPTTQVGREGSEIDRDVLSCALCYKRFQEMPQLAKHWKEDHKKEASLFQKGMACCECGQEYTNRGGLLRHWRSTHPTLAMSELGVIVCMICDAMFKDFGMLWMHVEDQHALEFSSPAFALRVWEAMMKATEEADELRDGLLPSDAAFDGSSPNAGIRSSSKPAANGNDPSTLRFKCKFCGQRFHLLPDLGRHHQAEHRKPTNKPSSEVKLPPLVKRTPLPFPENTNSPPVMESSSVPAGAQAQNFNFRHLKVIAREKKTLEEANAATPSAPSSFAPPPAASSGQALALKKRRRRRKRIDSLQSDKLVPGKKKIGRPRKHAVQIVQHMKAVQQERLDPTARPSAFRAVVNDGVKPVAKMPPHRAVINPAEWPSSPEILEAARAACCKDSMYRELAKKFTFLHPNLHLQAIGLLSVMNADYQWLTDTYLCPNRCSSFHDAAAPSPALEVDLAGFSEAPFKSQADYFNDEGPATLETINIKDVIKGKSIVMYEDLSKGQEPVPIPCVVDEDVLRPCSCASCRENGGNPSIDIAEPWKCFNYINKRLLDPSLGLDTEGSRLGCACKEGRCRPGHCDHVMMFDNDNQEACDKFGFAIRGRFPYDEQGRIILEDGYMVYECNSSCNCWEDCQNRILQRGVRVKLEVFKSRHKGWAVRTAEPIQSGTFVCEYIGEVLHDKVANARGERYDKNGCSYLYDIDNHLNFTGSRGGQKPFVIDATNHGNVARFINHSCAPNLINRSVLVESMDCQLAHIGFFACRDIGAGEELAYDYRYKLLPGKGTPCHCGAAACRGRLY